MATTKAKPKQTPKQKAQPQGPARTGLLCRVGRQALLEAADWAKRAAAGRTTKDQLRMVRVEGHQGGEITVRATDLAVAATCRLMGEVDRPGAVLLDPHRLGAILGNGRADLAEVDAHPGTKTVLTCGGRFEFPEHQGGDDLPGPTRPEGQQVAVVGVESGPFRAAWQQVAWGADQTGKASPVLQGVWLGVTAGTLTLIGTDAKHGGLVRVPVTGAGKLTAEAVLPVKPVGLFLGRAGEAPAELWVGTTLCCLRADHCEVVFSHLSGTHPAAMVEKIGVMPEKGWLAADKGDLFAAVRQAAAGIDPERPGVELSPAGLGLGVRAQDADVVVPGESGGDAGVLPVRIDPEALLRAEDAFPEGVVRLEVTEREGVVRVPTPQGFLLFCQLRQPD